MTPRPRAVGLPLALRLSLIEMPYAACPQGHKRFPSTSFSAHLMDLVGEPDSYRDLPSATRKRLFTKHYHCPACAQELPSAPTGRRTLDVAGEIGKAAPFRVCVEVPVFKCGGCGKESKGIAAEPPLPETASPRFRLGTKPPCKFPTHYA